MLDGDEPRDERHRGGTVAGLGYLTPPCVRWTNPSSFSLPPRLALDGANRGREPRRRRRAHARPPATSALAAVSGRTAALVFVALRRESDSDASTRAHGRFPSSRTRRSPSTNSSPSSLPRAHCLPLLDPGELLLLRQPPLPSSSHRCWPHHERRSSPPPSCSPPWSGRALGTPAVSLTLHSFPWFE